MTHRDPLPRAARALIRAALLATAAAGLAGCSGGREAIGTTLGLNYESPNAFNVAPHAPLRLPPSFEALPAPQPGAPSPLDPQPRRSAEAALSSAGAGQVPAGAGVAPTPGELALVDAAGGQSVDPAIREKIAADPPPQDKSNLYGLSSIFGYDLTNSANAEAIDPRSEAEAVRARSESTPTPTPKAQEDESNEFTIPLGG